MKPLTESQKAWAYRNLRQGPLRFLAEPSFNALIAAELLFHRILDWSTPIRPQAAFSNLTALVKTFERRSSCQTLLDSIRRFYPEMKIIVVDDSRQAVEWPGTKTHKLPFDSGVATGRSEGLNLVDTQYVLNLDDDFVFFKHTDLGAALAIMERHPEIDLMGGQVIDLPLYVTHESRSDSIFWTDAMPLRGAGDRVGGLAVADKVANFFIARTHRIKAVDWDRSLKRLDHADFFTRAKGQLLSVHNPSFQILHVKNPFDTKYRKFRDSIEDDLAYLSQKYTHPPPAPND